MKNHLILSFVFSVLMYLLISFLRWDILWVFDIGGWDVYQRGLLLIALLVGQLAAVGFNTGQKLLNEVEDIDQKKREVIDDYNRKPKTY